MILQTCKSSPPSGDFEPRQNRRDTSVYLFLPEKAIRTIKTEIKIEISVLISVLISFARFEKATQKSKRKSKRKSSLRFTSKTIYVYVY